MRVLSLFDGISCARVALERAGMHVDTYYSSEIETHPITVAQKNYPTTIQLGDIKDLTNVRALGPIDLLIGGSPCQDLSRAKTDGKGLKGARSSLFYEYLRILHEVESRYFILENVASMKAIYKDEISRELGVQPIMIDAALVSAQTRKRLFWTNIPGVTQPEDRGILLRDVLEIGYALDDKARTLTKSYMKGPCIGNMGTHRERTMVLTEDPGSIPFLEVLPDGRLKVREATKKGYTIAEDGDSVDTSFPNSFPNSKTRRGRVGKKAKNLMTAGNISVWTKGQLRPLTPVECERLQSLPDGYTEGIPKTHRVGACGNAFNVEVVAHILRHIPGGTVL